MRDDLCTDSHPRDHGRLLEHRGPQSRAGSWICSRSLARTLSRWAELARRSGAHKKGLERLCDYLSQLGLVRKNAGKVPMRTGRCSLPGSTIALVARPAVADFFLISPFLTQAFAQLPQADKEETRADGACRGWDSGAEPSGLAAVREGNVAAAIVGEADLVVQARRLERQRLARGRFGTGLRGLAHGAHARERHPRLALVAQDWPHVLTIAAEHARQTGSRIELNGCQATHDDRFAGPYDLVLMANFVDYFDAATRLALLRKAHAALRPGGFAAIYAPLWMLRADRGRPSPTTCCCWLPARLEKRPRSRRSVSSSDGPASRRAVSLGHATDHGAQGSCRGH